jgi:cell division protein FtsB
LGPQISLKILFFRSLEFGAGIDGNIDISPNWKSKLMVNPARDNLGIAASALLLLAGFVLLVGTIRGEHSISTYFELQRSADVLSARIKALEIENQATSDEIHRLKKSSDYARKVLRDQYHVLDSNENIIFYSK